MNKNILCKKCIFNFDNNIYLKDIINAIKVSVKQGFEFVRFNDIIYFIDENNNIHKTRIPINMV